MCGWAALLWRLDRTDGPNARVPACSEPQGQTAEKAASAVQSQINLQALPIRQYLDQTVVPLLLQALSALVKERCVPPPSPAAISAPFLRGCRCEGATPAFHVDSRARPRPRCDPCVLASALSLLPRYSRPADPVEYVAAYLLKNNTVRLTTPDLHTPLALATLVCLARR